MPSSSTSPAGRSPVRVARALPWLVLAVTLAAGVVLWRTGAAAARQHSLDLLAQRTDDLVARLEERVHATRQLLLGARGLFEALGDVDREAWRDYLAPVSTDEHYRGILGVGVSRWIPASALDAHVRAVRAAGRPGYRIWPPGERAAYTGVIMNEPPTPRNESVIGLDMYAEPTRRAAMDEARDSGVATMSRRVVLRHEPQGQESQASVLVYAALYRRGAPTGTPEARRAALEGWVWSAVRVGDLVEATLGTMPEGLELTIEEADAGAVLFASAPGAAPPRGALVYRREVDFLGRRWVVSALAPPGFGHPPGEGWSGGELATMAVALLLVAVAFVLQRRAERDDAAREAARRRILFEASPDGMVLLDPETGRIVEFNTVAHTQLGYTREEFARLRVFDVEAGETSEETRERIAGVLRSGRADFETRQRTKTGELRLVHVTAQIVRAGGQQIYQCAWRDITERRRVEEELREAHRRLRQLGDNLPGGFVFQTLRGPDGGLRYTHVSAGVEKVLGVTPEAILANLQALHGRTAPEDQARIAEAARRSAETLTPFSLEIPTRAASGAEVWLHLSAAPRRLPDGGVQLDGVALDVTARRRAEADRLLMSTLESTGLLAGGIAHDFNNLLATVLLGVELAREEPCTPAAASALDGVVEAIEAARGLTRQLILFARGGEPVRQPTDLERLARESTRLALTGSSIASDLSAEPGLWPADVDEGQVAQIIRNLVLNAREAMPDGGVVTLRLRNVAVGPGDAPDRAPGEFVELTVADRGGGIALGALPRIFEPYFSTKERGADKGMGLGLTICHSVVKKHGGSISVESVPGQGTTFRVLLPARPDAVLRRAPPPRRAPAGARRGKVLVMDDEEPLRRVLAATLEQLGCTVVEAATGEEAVERWGQARADGSFFDLLVLDLTVRNGMGGLETLRLLRGVDRDTPAVLMSGHAESDALLDPARHGFSEALRKPFDAEALRRTLERNLPGA